MVTKKKKRGIRGSQASARRDKWLARVDAILDKVPKTAPGPRAKLISYHEAKSLLAQRGVEEHEVPVWVMLGALNAYQSDGAVTRKRGRYHPFSFSPFTTSGDLVQNPHLQLTGVYFRKREIETFDPLPLRLLTYDKLLNRWVTKYKTDAKQVERLISEKIGSGELYAIHPVSGFADTPQEGLYLLDQIRSVEQEHFGDAFATSQDRVTAPKTVEANITRRMKQQARHSALNKFAETLYINGEKHGHNWAIQRQPLPFTKNDFVEVFLDRYPLHRTSPETIKQNDLKAIGRKFKSGVKSSQKNKRFLQSLA